jgi:hypothetical protein
MMNVRPRDSFTIFIGVAGIIFAFMFHSIIGGFSVLLGMLGLVLIIGATIHSRKER